MRLAVLVASAVAVTGLAVTGTVLGVAYATADVDTVGRVAFERPLAVPPLAQGRVGADGTRTFDLTVQPGETDFGFDRPTPTWGVNGGFLAPTLLMHRGDRVAMNVSNELPEATTLHWHGMRLPARMDGGPHQMVEPGSTWSPDWTVDQPAATLWYHPHLHGSTTEHAYRGVTGMIIVEDDEAAGKTLPGDYGVDDIPLIVADKKFRADGSLDTSDGFIRLTGLLGDTVTVNGTIGGYLDVTTQRVRLRLLNASTARIYQFGFSDDRSFALVATDGGLLGAPVGTTRLQLSPGERAEVVVTMTPGEQVTLRSYPPDLQALGPMARFSGGHDSFDVLQVRAAAALRPSPEPAAVLSAEPFEGLAEDAAGETRYFQLQGAQVNGREMDMARIDTVVTAGSTEVWEVSNGDGYPHNFHVHDVQFRVLDVDGRPPPLVASGRKDTVFVPPGKTVRLLIRFGDDVDPDHPYMYHCHLLRHEDGGMMGQFVVVAPGQQAGAVPTPHTTHTTG